MGKVKMRRYCAIDAVASALSRDDFDQAVNLVCEVLNLVQISVPARHKDDLWLREKRNFWSTPGYWLYKINYRPGKTGVVAVVEVLAKEHILTLKWDALHRVQTFTRLLQAFSL